MRKILLFFVLFWSTSVKAQDIEAGALVGLTIYNGDLSARLLSEEFFMSLHTAQGIFARVFNGKQLAARLDINYTKVSGSDEVTNFPGRGLSFESVIVESNVVGEFYFVKPNYFGDSEPINGYLFAGVTVLHFNPKTEYMGDLIPLQPLGTEGQGLEGYKDYYSRINIAIPFGAGVRFQLTDRVAFGLEFSARRMFTDYLDDVSGTIIQYEDLYDGKGPMVAELSLPGIEPSEDLKFRYFRGSKRTDWYYLFGARIAYRLNEKKFRKFGF
ncbi:MAG TPA: DUF6089 family protein [Saprospiraceae bacterium]|nr:DUF6089 family protein [Saprospiraceae bacterium]HMQ82044.1 DUF6089 family protein [Saprospiraceae bacterium]